MHVILPVNCKIKKTWPSPLLFLTMPSEPEKERKVTQKRKKNNIASLQEGTDKTSESVEVG